MTDEDIRTRYKSGATLREIAAEAGHGHVWVQKRLIAMNVSRRDQGPRRGPRLFDLATAHQMRQAGATYRKVAAALGVSLTCVYNHLSGT